MLNSHMLTVISYIAAIAFLVVGSVFGWELWKRRIIPPFRIERAKHPRWYWSCIVTHGVILGLIVLVCAALALASFFNDFFN